MFNRLRKLKLSLAAKCQILFGAAVILIIAAALLVPWLRMEQLADQIDRRAATMLSYDLVRRHVEYQQARQAQSHPTQDGNIPSTPSTRQTVATSPRGIDDDQPSNTRSNPDSNDVLHTGDRSDAGDANHAEDAGDQSDSSNASAFKTQLVGTAPTGGLDQLTTMQQNALRYFLEYPDKDTISRTYMRNSQRGYRYAQALYAQQSCLSCHTQAQQDVQSAIDYFQRDRKPARAAATNPAASAHPLLGIALIDIPSQVQSNQILLNRIFILMAGLFAGALATVVFWLITFRVILRPVRVLQETAQKVSEGDLNIRSDINTGDEFEQLSETFNQMLSNLKQSEDQLRLANKSLDLKLGQLSQVNVDLYKSNRLKSEFLANVSHELRTPLNSILGFADLLKESPDPQGKNHRYIQNILRSGQHLLTLINDLLDLAKIEAGRMEVHIEAVSLADIFEGLASLLKPLYEARRITLQTFATAELPVIHTDPAKLQQILYNFLANAIKFSPTDDTIQVRALHQDAQTIRITVSDHGPGIDPSEHELIFEKFRQVDASVTREHEGSGLGLAISKELAGLLGAKIGVISSLGQGALFWLDLPIGAPAEAHTAQPQ